MHTQSRKFMNTDTQFKLHLKQAEIDSLEEIHFEAHLLFRSIQDMLIEHGETKDGVELEQDVRKILSKIRKMLKKINDIDN